MIHLRYYIVLLIGIFLSLGIGISIGISLEDKDFIEKQQKTLTQQIVKNVELLKKENGELQKKNQSLTQEQERYKTLSQTFFSELACDSLNGMNISIIDIGENESYQELEEFIQMTKAKITGYIAFPGRGWEDTKAALAEQGTNIQTNSDITAYLSRNLVETLSSGLPSEYFSLLLNNSIVKAHIPVNGAADVILLIDKGIVDKASNTSINTTIIKEASSVDIPILYVTNEQAPTSLSQKLLKYGIKICEKMNTLQGKFNLLSTLEEYYQNKDSENANDGMQ